MKIAIAMKTRHTNTYVSIAFSTCILKKWVDCWNSVLNAESRLTTRFCGPVLFWYVYTDLCLDLVGNPIHINALVAINQHMSISLKQADGRCARGVVNDVPMRALTRRSSRSKKDRAIEMTRVMITKDAQTSATLPLIAVDEAVRISLLPL